MFLMAPATGLPQQQRSRKTLEKLLAATLATFEAHGLEGATIPRIAQQARVSVGSVYRRFEDKDALFRAALLRLLEKGVETNRQNLRPEMFAGMSIEIVTRLLVRSLIHQFRVQPGVLRALENFLQHHPNLDFRERALALIAESYQRIAAILLIFREKITHPDPERAALFAILSAVTVIQARTLENDSVWEKVAPLDDSELEREVTTLVLAYLLRIANE